MASSKLGFLKRNKLFIINLMHKKRASPHQACPCSHRAAANLGRKLSHPYSDGSRPSMAKRLYSARWISAAAFSMSGAK